MISVHEAIRDYRRDVLFREMVAAMRAKNKRRLMDIIEITPLPMLAPKVRAVVDEYIKPIALEGFLSRIDGSSMKRSRRLEVKIDGRDWEEELADYVRMIYELHGDKSRMWTCPCLGKQVMQSERTKLKYKQMRYYLENTYGPKLPILRSMAKTWHVVDWGGVIFTIEKCPLAIGDPVSKEEKAEAKEWITPNRIKGGKKGRLSER